MSQLYALAPGCSRNRSPALGATSWGRARGCGEVWLGTEPDNAPALALHRSLRLPERVAVIFEDEL